MNTITTIAIMFKTGLTVQLAVLLYLWNRDIKKMQKQKGPYSE